MIYQDFGLKQYPVIFTANILKAISGCITKHIDTGYLRTGHTGPQMEKNRMTISVLSQLHFGS